MNPTDPIKHKRDKGTGPGVEDVMHHQSPGELHNSDESIGQPDAGKFPKEFTRRKFLSRMSIAMGGLVGVVVAVPVVGYLFEPLLKPSPDPLWREVGSLNDFDIGKTREVTFEDTSSLPWAGVTSKTAAWLRRTSDKDFIAFAVNCTHLGCPVSWLPDAGLFECPCHGGVYYANGNVAGGPPPYPLSRYDVRVNAQSGKVEVKASGIPIVS